MRTAAAAACVLLAGPACGAEDRPAAGGSTGLRSAANAVCADTFDLATLQRSARDGGVAREAARWERGLDRLAALDARAPDAERFRTMVAHLRRMATRTRRADRAADETALPYLIGALAEGRRASRIAHSLGLDRCVVVPATRRPPRDREGVAEAARALVPAGARVTTTLGCDEESCLLALDRAGADTTRAAVQALEREGWRGIRRGGTPGSRWVTADRNDLQATFGFPSRDRPPCDTRATAPFCADTLWVRRIKVLDFP